MKHIFIEGEKHIGKSTIIRGLMPILNREVFGFYTIKEEPETDGLSRVFINDVNDTRNSCCLDNCVAICGPDGGRARAEVFETEGVRLLSGIPDKSAVIMDELGVFESDAYAFQKAVFDLLVRDVIVLGAIKKRDTDFLYSIKNHPKVRVFNITHKNRSLLYCEIVNYLKGLSRVEPLLSGAGFGNSAGLTNTQIMR